MGDIQHLHHPGPGSSDIGAVCGEAKQIQEPVKRPWELENRMSYSLGVTVFRKNGKKKWVYYKGYKTAKLATPQDMEAAMREHGIPCVMVEK